MKTIVQMAGCVALLTLAAIELSGSADFAAGTGAPLVRPASYGVSSAFDPWGRLLSTADYFAPGDGTMTVQVPIGRVGTLYASTGDLFAWLCVAGLVLAAGIAALG